MINLTSYQNSSASFLTLVINSKRKGKDETPPYYKDRILSLSPIILQAYSVYDTAFLHNNLHTVTSTIKFSDSQKSDALKLYKYDTRPFTILKNTIITRPNNYELHTCQYCAINSINTLDHIMPKDDFPEFAVHPKNLFPACSQCNSYKSTKWMTNGVFEFLNPYLHLLPSEQFLFASVNYLNNTFDVSFYLNNSNNIIPSYLFNIIQNHYRNLHLLDRYRKESFKIISEFENTIRGALTAQSLNDALNCARITVQLNQAQFGFNHFENILKLELCNGIAFRQYCQAMGY
ncbi:HNH endonuclease [Acinetobacter nosocomialis]|uniref:HNH endonuclease n=1 Tax=Acinetobacter nosocomialis TaxID=106654 RepID=UPI000D0B923E|nr:HNH endonuclease [Acinetobacter nosocomialis]PSE42920.1 HNH endonuclease [Acinetobacter nosocomialis]PSE84562.1 HNH endonuclease [Acinetobacter nosocomialis]